MVNTKKRNLSVFDAIQELETEDVRAEQKRQKQGNEKARRGKAAQCQTKIYQHLVECRILMQRALVKTTKDSGDDKVVEVDDDDKAENVSLTETCNTLLETLLQARRQLVAGNHDDNDSDDDDDNDDPKTVYSKIVRNEKSNNDLHEMLQQEYDTCREEWKEVLDRRHKDLKLHSGLTAKSQFRVMDSTFWQQVDATVEYEQLRQSSTSASIMYDDSKIYQQLLKDFVSHSSAMNAAGSVDAAKQRQRSTQSNPQTTKKQVDRRASKGRKIRYKEIPKLVNFTFPLSRPRTAILDQEEWFKSLFGGVAGKV